MPRYFFHYRDDGHHVPDPEGMVLPDAEAAWFQAVRNVRDRFELQLKAGCPHPECCVEIADEGGDPVAAVPFQHIGGLAG